MTLEQAMMIKQLHATAVKANMRWDSATPGTKTKRDLEKRAERADTKFNSYIDSLIDPSIVESLSKP